MSKDQEQPKGGLLNYTKEILYGVVHSERDFDEIMRIVSGGDTAAIGMIDRKPEPADTTIKNVISNTGSSGTHHGITDNIREAFVSTNEKFKTAMGLDPHKPMNKQDLDPRVNLTGLDTTGRTCA